ncbi:UNVERIFIED_CONTAM: hypothetical protein FKN15_020585 [Acipenser sinensis]
MVEDSRPSWENPMQFVLACVSYAVGLGNVWRFPYLCQMHGGGGFLIPYLIMLVVEGLPLFYLELAIGQHMRQGSIGAWSAINPYMVGVGIASVVVSIFLTIYYNVINAWSFWYLFHSFQGTLPWAECPLSSNLTTYVPECEKSSSTDYFWYRETLNISSSIEDHGGIQMGQALCLVLSWMVVYLCVLRGTEATGKVVYFTATFPYLVMIIYLIRGVTLHGALNGLKYMFTPKVGKYGTQLLLINTFDLAEDSIKPDNLDDWISHLNASFPDMFATISSQIEGCDLESELDTAVEGTGLAFIVYSEAIKNMGLSQLWSVLYFSMLLMLGIGSMLGNVAAIITPLRDSAFLTRLFRKETLIGEYPDETQPNTFSMQCLATKAGKTVTKEYPPFAQVVIGLLLVTSMICVPLVALITFIKKKREQAKESKINTTAS